MGSTSRGTRWKYLRAISKLSSGGSSARNGQIADLLGVSPASVTEMMRTLAEQGFVVYNARRGARLTEMGVRELRRAAERRSVLQRFFMLIGLSAEDAEKQAAMIEAEIGDESFWSLRYFTERLEESSARQVSRAVGEEKLLT